MPSAPPRSPRPLREKLAEVNIKPAAPYPDPSPALQAAIAARHNLHGDWRLLAPRGEIHTVYQVGYAVVRIPRDDPEYICDTLTEIVTLQALSKIDFPTPRLLAFDTALDLLPVPYCITAYFDGHPHADQQAAAQTLEELGSNIARLHSEVTEVPDPQGWLDDVGNETPRAELDQCVFRQSISPDEVAWCQALLDRLEPLIETDLRTVFVHNDVHELNILSNGHTVQLIDWGDAGWGDPSFDFCVLPAHWVGDVLASYGRHLPVPPGMRARIIWNQLGKALRRLGGPARRQSYGRRRLDGLKACADKVLES